MTTNEAKSLGWDLSMTINRAREVARSIVPLPCDYIICPSFNSCDAVCVNGTHVCLDRGASYHPPAVFPRAGSQLQLDAVEKGLATISEDMFTFPKNPAYKKFQKHHQSHKDRWGCEQGDVYYKVEERVFRLHSYHLVQASAVFAQMADLPQSGAVEGANVDNPIFLPDVPAADFENLVFFFYAFAYSAPAGQRPHFVSRLESILRLADRFDMKEVGKVVLRALPKRGGGMTDARKICLSLRFDIDSNGLLELVKSLCERSEGLSVQEGYEVGAKMVVLIGKAREALKPGSGGLQLMPMKWSEPLSYPSLRLDVVCNFYNYLCIPNRPCILAKEKITPGHM